MCSLKSMKATYDNIQRSSMKSALTYLGEPELKPQDAESVTHLKSYLAEKTSANWDYDCCKKADKIWKLSFMCHTSLNNLTISGRSGHKSK